MSPLKVILQLAASSVVMSCVFASDNGMQLINIGSVEGKFYFIENTRMTWKDAKAHCTSQGFKMAEINSQAQLDFLSGRFNDSDFTGLYWTAGRDALSEDQFMWHNSHITIKESGLTINEYVPAYQCLIYRKQYDSEEGFLHTGACNGEEKVLCELQ